jgi:hypothetical protein
MPLEKGQWVKIKKHETFGIVIGERVGDRDLSETERSYKIHVDEQTLYRHPSDVEVVEVPTAERVVLSERYARFNEAAAKLLASNPPYDQGLVKAVAESLRELGFLRKSS